MRPCCWCDKNVCTSSCARVKIVGVFLPSGVFSSRVHMSMGDQTILLPVWQLVYRFWSGWRRTWGSRSLCQAWWCSRKVDPANARRLLCQLDVAQGTSNAWGGAVGAAASARRDQMETSRRPGCAARRRWSGRQRRKGGRAGSRGPGREKRNQGASRD